MLPRLLLYVTLAGLLAGCGGADSTANVQRATVDGLTIALEAPAAPTVLDQAGFVITLTDASGAPVDGADVYLELGMDGMPMGSNTPIATGEGKGVYRAQSVFDMAGAWSMTVNVSLNGKDYAATFATNVAEQRGA
jgi:hypothetical protein